MSEPFLNNRVALVTGAGSGIGAATARVFAREGAAVALVDINLDNAEKIATEIRQQGGRAIALKVDVRGEEGNQAMVEKTVAEFGALHIAHLHAGGTADTTVLNANLENFDNGIGFTLRGCFLGMTACAPAIVAAGGGAIVATSSQAGLKGQRSLMAYTAAKHGVIGLVKSAAAELGPLGVRVNAVCPASVYTGIFTQAFPNVGEIDAFLGKHNALGRVGRPEEVAELVAFLASERAAFITGCAVPIDGGSSNMQSPMFQNDIDALGSKLAAFATRKS